MGKIKPEPCELCAKVKGKCVSCNRVIGLDDHLLVKPHRNAENKGCSGAGIAPVSKALWPKIDISKPSKPMRRINLDAVSA